MKGHAVIYTDKESQPRKDTRVFSRRLEQEPASMRTGESRLIRLQKQLEKDGIAYTTAFGLNDQVEVYWGDHPMNVQE